MQTGVLIIGQGISGTFLSWYLRKQGVDFLVVDNNYVNAPSRVAAGVINPVTGRRLVTVWMAEQLFPFAWQAYNEIGDELGITVISQKNILDLFPNPFMRESFLKKIEEGDQYVSLYEEHDRLGEYFNYEFGCGEIKPVYTAHIDSLLPAWRKELARTKNLLEENFDLTQLDISGNSVRYKDITADKIIFCDGPGCADNPYFNKLPFAANKGEALVVEIPGLPNTHVYKKSMLLVPLQQKDHFWIGSSYAWDFENADPSAEFRESTLAILKNWLRVSHKLVEHRSGLRPATLERRPFAGLHPVHTQVGILNGMGTKGCSLAPFFAKQLADHLLHDTPIAKDADVRRFTKILSRS